MPTLTPRKRKEISKQLADIQARINAIKAARTPAPPLPIAGKMPLNPAQTIGAAGRGADNYSDETNAAIGTATGLGVPMAALGDKNKTGRTNLERPQGYSEPRLTAGQVAANLKSFGLEGLVDGKNFVGLTQRELNQKLLQEKQMRKDQVSANTTFAFNPETLKRTERAVDKFGFALDEIGNDPFEPKEYKKEQSENAKNIVSKEIAGLFENSDQLYSAFESNKQFQDTLAKFMKQGGTIQDIAKNISTPVTQQPLEPGQEATNTQSPTDYLASLSNPNADPQAQKLALEELAPESDIAQAEISRLAGIPDELKTLYFGDEKTMGMIQMKKAQAVEKIRIAEEQERDDKRSVKAKAELLIDKSRAETEQAEAEIEENRLAAKNYMTAQLAKLGALKTTGAAVLSLKTLDAKYAGKVTQIQSAFKLGKRQVEIELMEKLDKIENDTDSNILKIEEDLTLDSEKTYKEILKARTDADKEIYTITEQYARRLRERIEDHKEKLKKEAEEYAKNYAKTVSNALAGSGFNYLGKPNKNNRIISQIEQKLEASRGADTHVNSEVYKAAMQEWIAAGGTANTFLTTFPTAKYANPNDTSLPFNLQYSKPSQTESTQNSDDILAEIENMDFGNGE